MREFGDNPVEEFPSLSPFVLGQHIDANYYDQSAPQARGNPLIAVLKDGRSSTEMAKLLIKRPSKFNPAVLSESITARTKRLIADLHDLHIPCKFDLELARRVELAMYTSLLDRNPLGPPREFRSPERGITLLGPAGVGKSAALQHVLVKLFPQRITHTHFQTRPFEFEQILWMHLEVPSLGTVKELCHTFFHCAAAILEDKRIYGAYTKHGNATDDRLLVSMKTFIANHGIALLSLDEVGQLKVKSSERELNALFGLLNGAGVAVSLTGTFEALPLLRAHGRVLGRISSQGDWIRDRMTKESPDWKTLLTAFGQVQYIRHPVALTGDISDAFYEETQGFIRYFKELFGLTQQAAMEDGSERLTPKLIHNTAQNAFRHSRPMLEAFRLGDRTLLSKYPQMFPSLEDPFIHGVANSNQINGALAKAPEVRIHSSATAQSPDKSKHTPSAAPGSHPMTPGKKPKKRHRGQQYESPLREVETTLPNLVERGRQTNTAQRAYSTLQAEGVTKSVLELLPVEGAVSHSQETSRIAG